MNLEDRDKNGRTLLHRACEAKQAKTVSVLVAAGADVNSRDGGGTTPLLATDADATDILEILLTAGADPNAANEHGSAPLHAAALKYNYRSIRSLLKNGANPTLRNRDGKSPLDFAAMCLGAIVTGGGVFGILWKLKEVQALASGSGAEEFANPERVVALLERAAKEWPNRIEVS